MPNNTLSPEDQAFIEDLRKARYDNPELYKDPPSLPPAYRIRINSSLLPGSQTIIRIEIDGDALRKALVEADLNLLSRNPEPAEVYESFAKFRRDAEGVSELSGLQRTQWKFVLRHFPQLFLNFYDITILSSFVATWLSLWRESQGDDLNKFENLARSALRKEIESFLNKIKLIVETCEKGRPPGSTKAPEERTRKKETFEQRIEGTIRSLLATSGRMPTKTVVAKALGIGGLNPKTGIDSSLTAFNNKLKRLEIDYRLIVKRIEVNK